MEVAKFTTDEKSASSSQHCQVHGDRFFSTSKALSTMNSYPLVKPSMASFTVRFWYGWGKEFGANVQPDRWKKNNRFLHHDNLPTHTSLVRQFLTSKNITVIPHPPIRLTLPPATFSYSPRWNYSWKGIVLTQLRRSTQKCRRLSTHIWELPGMHEITGNMLGSLYTCPTGLLWRRRWKLRVTVRNFFLWSNSPSFWVAPRTSPLPFTTLLSFHNIMREMSCIQFSQALHMMSFFMSSFNTSVTFKQLKQLECDESDDPEDVPPSELKWKSTILYNAWDWP